MEDQQSKEVTEWFVEKILSQSVIYRGNGERLSQVRVLLPNHLTLYVTFDGKTYTVMYHEDNKDDDIIETGLTDEIIDSEYSRFLFPIVDLLVEDDDISNVVYNKLLEVEQLLKRYDENLKSSNDDYDDLLDVNLKSRLIDLNKWLLPYLLTLSE